MKLQILPSMAWKKRVTRASVRSPTYASWNRKTEIGQGTEQEGKPGQENIKLTKQTIENISQTYIIVSGLSRSSG